MNNVFEQCTKLKNISFPKLTTVNWVNTENTISTEACYHVLFDNLCERFPQYADDFMTIKRLYSKTNQSENENVIIQIIAFLIEKGKFQW